MSEFSLHRLVREVITEHREEADPGALADTVFERIAPDDYAAALRTVLRRYVRQVMNEERYAPVNPDATLAPPAADWDGSPDLTAAIQRGVQETERGESIDLGDFSEHLEQDRETIVHGDTMDVSGRLGHPATASRPARSSYREAMQAGAWRQRLSERIHGASGWLLLRDCGVADLKAAAAERRDLAAANAASAAQFEKLHDLLAASGEATVGQLSDKVLQEALAA